MTRASRPPRRAVTPGTGPHPRRWTLRWGPSRPVVPRDRAGTFTPRLVRKGQRRLDGLDACESPGLMRRWNDGAGYPAPPGLHAQRGCSARGPFRGPADEACGGCPACGSTRPLEESSSRWSTTGAIRADGPRLLTGSPPTQPTSRSERGMDGCQAHGLSIWAPDPGREPP